MKGTGTARIRDFSAAHLSKAWAAAGPVSAAVAAASNPRLSKGASADRHTNRFLSVFVPCALMLSGCSGTQSALDPAGVEAEAVYWLFWVCVIGGAVIWAGVMAVLFYAGRCRSRAISQKAGQRIILFGGVLFPTLVLAALLSYALWLMPMVRPVAARADVALTIDVTGEQFWWRVSYPAQDGLPAFETANEIRLPVGERVGFNLRSADVIHSFWVPALGGKMDMIPGRANFLSLKATRTGLYRAPCAEFCGTSHAVMGLTVVVMEPEAFAAWRRAQDQGQGLVEAGAEQPAALPVPADGGPAQGAGIDEASGIALFQRHGCAACHALRGTPAQGRIGPDLTRLGERATLAAGTLPNTQAALMRFIRNPQADKPGALMPAFPMIPEQDLIALARYLRADP